MKGSHYSRNLCGSEINSRERLTARNSTSNYRVKNELKPMTFEPRLIKRFLLTAKVGIMTRNKSNCRLGKWEA